MGPTLEIIFWFSTAVIAYSYIGYPGLLTILAKIFGHVPQADQNFRPSVAFIVPAYNEEKVIRHKLLNIFAIEYPADRISVWVGSDQSNDATVSIVRSMNDPRIRVWEAPRRGGKTAVLNAVAPLVDADIIIFTDANTMHRPDSIGRMAALFVDPGVGGVAGQILHGSGSNQAEFEERAYRSFEVYQKTLESKLHSTISCFGGFYAVRKELFVPIQPNAYSNDDVLIPMNIIRRKRRVIFEPAAVSYEDITESIGAEFKRRVRIGAGNIQAFFWLLDFLNPMFGWPWFCYVSHKATRWLSPLFMVAGAVSCWMLSEFTGQPLYRFLFSCAVAVVALGVSSQVFPFKLTKKIFYFLTMNVALIVGFWRFAKGIKTAAWDRTERK